MRIVFGGRGQRGITCLQALWDKGHRINAVVAHPEEETQSDTSVTSLAKRLGLQTICPENPNGKHVEQFLRGVGADLLILAGYGKILRQNIIDIPSLMCLNLHAGKLPIYRGSSPMNWALINGEKSLTLSIIKVDVGVDTGDILLERTFKISVDDTIRDLHRIANEQFPVMLLETVSQIEEGNYTIASQDNSRAAYYPRRFPEDGLILWDIYTAEQTHNRIRALTDPYPGAFTYFKGRKVTLLSSTLNEYDYFGEPGRIYRKSKRGLLVCALDKCLWIKEAVFADNGEPFANEIERYDILATLRGSVVVDFDAG